jgi:dynein heavy chain
LLYKNESGILKVNFDPALKRLLREVKYFQLLGIEVPEMAAEIFEKNDTFRDQTIQLDLIVNNYNEIISTLHPVEEPLVKEKIERIDECLKPGLEELKWKSPNINEFITDVKVVVDTTYEIV